MTRALIIVDVQRDFCEGGSLAVDGGAAVASAISDHLAAHGQRYGAVVATADWHIDPGSHWSDTPDFVDSWPVHCQAGTDGAKFHPGLGPGLTHVQAVFHKGDYAAAYSGFEGTTDLHGEDVGLGEWLELRGISEVDVCGIATDYCVRATALDAVGHGLSTTLLTDLCAGVAPESTERALAEMRQAGVTLA